MVVKFTSEMMANPSGGSSGLGFLVVINNLKLKETGKKHGKVMYLKQLLQTKFFSKSAYVPYSSVANRSNLLHETLRDVFNLW